MNKDKLILKNGTEIELEVGADLSDMRILFNTKEEMLAGWNTLTQENLSEVRIKNSDGITVNSYEGLVLVKETSTVRQDGTILTSFHLREKTDAEKRLDNLEERLEVHDGAIMDAAEILSSIVETQEREDA